MDIKEIRTRKGHLSIEIAKLIKEFEREVGLEVVDIGLDNLHSNLNYGSIKIALEKI